MTDPRFTPPPPVPHCLNCKHGRLDYHADKVHCENPARAIPRGQASRVEVIQWAVGCPQHEPQEQP